MRLRLIGLRGSVGGHFRYERHDGVYFRIYALDLFQMSGKRFARRELFRADLARHLDGAEETNRGIRGIAHESPFQEKRSSRPQQNIAAGGVMVAHAREVIPRWIFAAQTSVCGGWCLQGQSPTDGSLCYWCCQELIQLLAPEYEERRREQHEHYDAEPIVCG